VWILYEDLALHVNVVLYFSRIHLQFLLIKYGSFVQIVKPRPVQAASIPGMLGMFQNVWNLVYEVFFMIFGIFYLK